MNLHSPKYNRDYARAYRYARVMNLPDDVSFAYRFANGGGTASLVTLAQNHINEYNALDHASSIDPAVYCGA